MTWQEFAPTNYNADPLQGGGYATLVGTDPLATSDGDTSYVETYTESGNPAATKTGTFRLAPTASGSFSRVKVAAEFRGVGGAPDLVVWAWPADRLDPVNVAILPSELGSAYVTREHEIDFAGLPGSLSWFTADVAMASDTYWFVTNSTPDGGSQFTRTTWLRVYAWGGYIPLRWRNRNDRFGGAHAARSVSTYQATNRARGTL